MDSILEEKEEDNDFIKIYLHIHYPKIEDKPYYKIDLDKNILVLFDSVNRTNSEKDGLFEMDKIFTNENDYSYIYEEIGYNTIKESLNGESYVFISYGNTITDKLKILIGDVNDSYTHVEHRGLFPKLLEKLIITINGNISYRENLSINLSYFILLNDKLIDLSNFIGKNFNDFNENHFLKNAIELEKKTDNLKLIKKVPTENINDVLFFINKLFLLLINLEEESEYHLYTRGHFSIIIYITNNSGKIVSTLTFILLNGSEIMFRNNNSQISNKNLSKDNPKYKNNVSNSLIAVDTQYTYDSIIHSLKNNLYINRIPIKEQKDKKADLIIDYTEKNKISKLTRLLYDICFSPKKDHIKFRIIGSILPNTGYYESCKDTLMFLFNCQKAITSTSKSKEKQKNIGDLTNENYNNSRNEKARKNTMFDLENKIKIQTNTISELNKNIQKKQEKLIQLERYYKKQVEVLKNYFGYKGNVDILLSGDENTIDYREAQKIREAKDDINYYKRNINELEKKVRNKEEEIAQLKLEEGIRANDRTMISYYLGVNEIKKKKEKDNKNRNDIFNKIKIYEKEIENKDKIINALKNEIEKKSKIIMSIPQTIKNHMDKKDEESSVSSGEIIQIRQKKKEYDKSDFAQMVRYNNEEIKTLKSKYENLIKQKDKEIRDNNYNMMKIENDNKTRINLYEEELMKLYELFMNLVNYCQKKYLPFFNKNSSLVTLFKQKEELEIFVEKSEKEISAYNYPFIFKALNENKKYAKISPKNMINEKIIIDTKTNLINKNRINVIEEEKDIALNFDDVLPPTLQQINKLINSKNINNNFFYSPKELENMSKSRLIKVYNNIIKYINDLENNIKKYIEENEKFDKNDKNEENKKKFEKISQKIKNLNLLLQKEVDKNIKNKVVMDTQNKIIEKLQKENAMSKNILKYKNDFSSYKMSLTKSKDKYPILIQDQSKTISHNENNFLNYKKSSFHVKWRNNTENNYTSNIQPTNGTSGYSSYFKSVNPTLEDNTSSNLSKNKSKKRPFSSKPNKIKNQI